MRESHNVCQVRKVQRVHVFSPNEERRQKFAQEMTALCQCEIVPVANPEHAAQKMDIVITATSSREPVLHGLFKVNAEPGDCGSEDSHVAVAYSGHCFFIDETDQDTKSTFALLMELARLEVPGQAGHAPILTIPLGGR